MSTKKTFKYPGVREAMDGNTAVIMCERESTDAAGAYPITPSTQMGEYWLDKNQGTAGDIDVPFGRFFGPIFTHLRGRCNRVCAGGVGRLPLAHDDGCVAVDCLPDSRVP